MDKTTVSRFVKDDSQDIDLNNKMVIIYNVLKACVNEQSANRYMNGEDKEQRLYYLTGIPTSIIKKMFQNIEIPKAVDTLERNMLNTSELDFAIRRGFVSLYSNHEIPTKTSMQRVVAELSRDSAKCKQQLMRNGYIWRRLPKTKRAIITEHPQQSLQRQRYLQKINYYRELNRTVVYVMEKIMDKEHKYFNYFANYTNPQNSYTVFNVIVTSCRYTNGTVFSCNSISKCQERLEENFIKIILPQLPESSVIILEHKPYFSKTLPVPTIESEKRDMMKWLDVNKIPYGENFHRGELFELIQRLKGKADLHKFDAIVRARGHEIIRRPYNTDYLCYFRPIWGNILILTDGNGDITKVFKDNQDISWQSLETSLIANEVLVYSEDLVIENITDKILTMARTVDIDAQADAECDLEEDSLKQAEYFIKI